MGVRRVRWAGAGVGVVAVLLAGLVGCSAGVSADEAFAGESLAEEDVEGLRQIAERRVDGSPGLLLGKPSYPTVSRQLVPEQGTTLEDGFARLVAEAREDGWVRDPSTSTDTLVSARKELPEGRGLLRISIDDLDRPTRLLVHLSLH